MLIRCDRWQFLLRAIQHIAMTLETIQVLSDILLLVAVSTIKDSIGDDTYLFFHVRHHCVDAIRIKCNVANI